MLTTEVILEKLPNIQNNNCLKCIKLMCCTSLMKTPHVVVVEVEVVAIVIEVVVVVVFPVV